MEHACVTLSLNVGLALAEHVRVTGERMDEQNHSMALPNGQVSAINFYPSDVSEQSNSWI